MKEKMAIIVSSYDECEKMWGNFFKVFNHYWNNCKFNIYLINNFLSPTFKNVDVINTGIEIGWRNRILIALEKINEKYIMFFHEDYFLGKNIDNLEFDKIIEFMEKNNIKMYRLIESPKAKENSTYISPVFADERYGINLQCAIWDKEEFIKKIKEIDGELPWDFENYFLKKCQNSLSEVIEGYVVDKRNILALQHGISKGKWLNKTIKYFKKERIELDLCNKNKMNYFEELNYNLKEGITNSLSKDKVLKLKKFLKFIKIKCTTEY